MDNHAAENGNISFLISIMLGILTWFLDNAELAMRVILFIGSASTALMACRYYWFATKNQKKEIKKNEDMVKK